MRKYRITFCYLAAILIEAYDYDQAVFFAQKLQSALDLDYTDIEELDA